MASTTYTQASGMDGETTTDNVTELAGQAVAAAAISSARAAAAEASATAAAGSATDAENSLGSLTVDAASVGLAGALMDSEVTNLADVKSFDGADYATAAQGTLAANALPKSGGALTGAVTTNSTFDGRDLAADGAKLDLIEAAADVTDATNVTAAGALMDSEVDDNLKTLVLPASTTISTFGQTLVDDADAATSRTTLGLGTAATTAATAYATAAQGTLAGTALQPDGDGSALTGIDTGGSSVSALTPAATVDIDLTDDDYFSLDLDQNTTLTMSNVAAGVDTFSLKLTGHQITENYYDIEAAEYLDKNMHVSQMDSQIYGFAFSDDGLTMFVVSAAGDSVYECTLSVAWDMNTSVYTGVSFSVVSEHSLPASVFFDPTGTKMYICGRTIDIAFQYTLSTAWDISTASYDSKSYDTTSQSTSNYDLALSPDGTKMYVLAEASRTLFQYTLSTAWDISTASYASKSLNAAAQASDPYSFSFTPDGLRVFVSDVTSDRIYEYTLSTAWDVSTASYASKSQAINLEDQSPTYVRFGDAGSYMYILGLADDRIQQFSIDGSTYATVTYPAAFNFPAGLAPDVPKDDVVNMLDFVTTDSGTTWYGTQIGEDYK